MCNPPTPPRPSLKPAKKSRKPPPPPLPPAMAEEKQVQLVRPPLRRQPTLQEALEAPAVVFREQHERSRKSFYAKTTAFWTPVRRQYAIIAVVNVVSFLQGASLPSSAIALPRLPRNESELDAGNANASWPRDFVVSSNERNQIGISWLYSHLVSGLVANFVAELLGRKKSLLIDCAAFALGFALMAVAEDVGTMCVARALLGYPLVNTVYLFELTHVEMRGVAAGMFALCNALGNSAILLLGAVIPQWRIDLGIVACVGLLGLACIAILPESPIWLLRKNRKEEAEQSMKKIYGDNSYVEDFEDLCLAYEMNSTRAKDWSVPVKNIVADVLRGKRSPPTPPFSFVFLFILFVLIGWSGFTHLTLNATSLFEGNASSEYLDSFTMSFLVSLGKIPGGVFAAVFLKRFSRRPVFLASAVVVLAAHVTMGLVYLDVFPSELAMAALASALFAQTAGYLSVSNLLLGVLLPSSSRSIFVGLVATTEGISALSQILLKDPIRAAVGDAGLFFVFAGVVFLALVYMFFIMPETKGKSLEEIEHIFLCDRQENCVVRRDPRETLTYAVKTVKRASKAVRERTGRSGKAVISNAV